MEMVLDFQIYIQNFKTKNALLPDLFIGKGKAMNFDF